MFFFLSVCLISLSLTVSHQTEADTVWFTDNGYAEFTSSVPLHEFTGKSSHLTGMIDFEENVVDFYLDVNTLKTGNERRDSDMYETLDSRNHPFAEFTGSLNTPFDPESLEEQNVTVTGTFTIHGVKQEQSVEGTLQKQGDELHIEAEWILDITDYDIEPPGILFYRVQDEMDVRIEVTMRQVDRDEL